MTKSSLLSETELTSADLAAAGSRYSVARLVDGARAIIGYAKADDGTLKAFGFDSAWRAAMSAKLKEVSNQKTQRVSIASAARPSGAAAGKAVDDARAWLKHAHAVLAALPSALHAEAPVESAHASRATRLADTLRPLASFFATHKGTAGYGASAAFAKEGVALAEALDGARATHKEELSKVAPDVFKLHVAEGVVALELARLSAVAHRALPSTRAKLYATTALRPRPSGKRAGKTKKGAGTPAAAPSK